MAALLRLEYVLSEDALKQAQALHLRKQYTGASKWRAWAKLLLFLAFFLGICYFRIRHEVAPQYQPWILLGVAGLFFLFYFGRGGSFRKGARQTQLEVTDRELTFTDINGRNAVLWSAVGPLQESASLFILVNRTETLLYTIPKDAFPDATAQDWFRTFANQKLSAPAPSPEEALPTQNLPANGLALKFQLRFTDYLIRNLSSWRIKGIALLMYGLIGFAVLQQYLVPDPNAVKGAGSVLFIMLLTVTGILVFVLFVVALFWWRAERKHNTNSHDLVLTDEGINFLGRSENGFVKWSAYENYLENRWCFIIWNRKTFNFFMFPKHIFPAEADQARCRHILKTKLQSSRWFFL